MPNVAVLFTDGKSNEPEETWKEAVAARKAGITLLVVGIGGGVSQKELTAIASSPAERNVLMVSDFDALSNILKALSDGLCDSEWKD